MRKLYCICMMVFSIGFLFACEKERAQTENKTTKQEEEMKVGNEVFSEDTFQGIKEIKFQFFTNVLDKQEDVQEVCEIITRLHLSEITDDKADDYWKTDGNSCLTFIYEDKTEKKLLITSENLYYNNHLYFLNKEESAYLFERLGKLYQQETR